MKKLQMVHLKVVPAAVWGKNLYTEEKRVFGFAAAAAAVEGVFDTADATGSMSHHHSYLCM